MAVEIDVALVRALLPTRPKDAHKGTFGHLFIIAGSRGFTGAAKLAAEAAGRSGAGLVTVGVPESLKDILAVSLTEAMSLPLPATAAETFSKSALRPALDFAANKSAVVLGPGLSQNEETKAFARAFTLECPVPLLLDADALNALSDAPESLSKREGPCVITPHPGEMSRLIGKTTQEIQANREVVAIEAAERFSCIVVLKGHRTIIADAAGTVFSNSTGNNGLAKGGTGDVLAGLIGGLMAQGAQPFRAAVAGVYAHGLAGDIAASEKTQRGMIAGDVIERIPAAWAHIERD